MSCKHKCNQLDCKHEKVKYCEKCGKVYCEECGREWPEENTIYIPQPYYPYESYPIYPNPNTPTWKWRYYPYTISSDTTNDIKGTITWS